MKLYFDENVPMAVAFGLRGRGVDVKTAQEAGLLGAGDPEHLDFAVSEGRALVTHDADFLDLARQGAVHRGIVYAPLGTSIGPLVNDLSVICFCTQDSDLTGQVFFLPM